MKTKKAIFTFFCCFLYYTASACDCVPSSLKQAFELSDYVVKVKVLEIKGSVRYDLSRKPIKPPYKYGNLPLLEVQKVYIGRLVDEEIELAATGSMCDYHFELGKEYVVLIVRFNGELVTSTCMYNFKPTNKEAMQEVLKLSKLE
ncbi:hypothetical protein [Pontibacter harenae]|uniref:hypothetical protein n=1 Tax=Pontibacter harenae TaxID=2894083 RepID=UPI001E60DD57|nr:hypothetical protein [Pontibacter harenae]MCC9169036.1 hypothetical protein [Pontibacter harenae]